MRILVVDDEAAMRTALSRTLEAEGYRVSEAADGEIGLEKACESDFDLVLLDVMMPGLDGYAVCRELRRRGRDQPILMLTARAQVDDRISGLDSGADDYLVKPFSLGELLARIRALLRRQERQQAVPDQLKLGEVTVCFKSSRLIRGREREELSAKELGMLRLLAIQAGEAVSRERFLDIVWGYNAYPSTRTVDNFVASLRSKIEPDPSEPRYLLTVRGVGYRLDLPSG